MKHIHKKISLGLLCAAMLCSMAVPAIAHGGHGHGYGSSQGNLLCGGTGLWSDSCSVEGGSGLPCVDLRPNATGWDRSMHTAQACTVESVTSNESSNTKQVVLVFEDGARATLRQDFSTTLQAGDKLQPGDKIGAMAQNPGAHHTWDLVEKDGKYLTADEIRQQALLDTTWLGYQQESCLRTSEGLWANYHVNLPGSVGIYGKGDVFTGKPCVVEKIAPFLGDENNMEVTLRFEDGTVVRLRQDFEAVVTEGQELPANVLVGSYKDKDTGGSEHISLSVEKDGKALTSNDILEQNIINTTVA